MAGSLNHHQLWTGLGSDDPEAEIGVLGIPFDSGVSWRSGARHAPERIRSLTPFLGTTTEEGMMLRVRVRDYGDMQPDLDWERFFADTEARAGELLQGDHRLALFIGGDHSVGIPLFRAFARVHNGPVGYIQFDSHADLCDNYQGHRWSHANTARRALEHPNLAPRHTAFVGLRSFLKEELDFYAANHELGWYPARTVHRRGIEAVAREIVNNLQTVEAVYLSVDIDGLDPSCAPGTGTPEHGGLSVREAIEFLHHIWGGLPVRAMDMVEVSPPLDISDMTSLAAIKIIYESFGRLQEGSIAR